MEKIRCTKLRPGSIAKRNYYSLKGELLIGEGVLITIRMIQLLIKRENYEIFVEDHFHIKQ